MREADVAIRMSPPRQPDLIQRHLLTMRTHIYGAREYLDKHGTPKTPEELDDHRLIVRSEEHTSELQSLMRISYAVFCLKQKNIQSNHTYSQHIKIAHVQRYRSAL